MAKKRDLPGKKYLDGQLQGAVAPNTICLAEFALG